MIAPETIQRLRQMREWVAVEEYIEATIDTLDRTSDIKGDDRAIAVEVLARKRAVEKLKEILQPFVDFQGRPDTSSVAQDKAKDAGL